MVQGFKLWFFIGVLGTLVLSAEEPKEVKRGFISYMKELLTYEGVDVPNATEHFGILDVPFAVSFANSQKTGRHLLIGCTIYKREMGCLPVILDIFRKFKDKELGSFSGRITVFLANPRAAGEINSNTASEANMSFGLKSAHTVDKERADELKKLFSEDVQLFIDLTSRRSKVDRSYYSFPYDETLFEFAEYLGASDTLIVPYNYSASEKELQKSQHKEIVSMSDYSRSRGIPTIGFEVLQKEKDDAANKATYEMFYKVVNRALLALGKLDSIGDIRDLTYTSKLKEFYQTVHLEEFKNQKTKLTEGLQDFQVLVGGQKLGVISENQEIVAPKDSLVIFNPKYPSRDDQGAAKEPLPPFLFKLLEKVTLEQISN